MTNNGNYTDNALVERLAEGDEEAFSIIFHRYFRPLSFFANSLIANLEDAKDIVQEMLYKCWVRRKDFNSSDNLKAYLYTATRNASLNYLRSAKRTSSRYSEMLHLAENDHVMVEMAATREDLLDMLVRELDELPANYSGILKLLFLEGLSYEQIALRLGIAEATARKQKERAVKYLRSSFLKKKLLLILWIATGTLK